MSPPLGTKMILYNCFIAKECRENKSFLKISPGSNRSIFVITVRYTLEFRIFKKDLRVHKYVLQNKPVKLFSFKLSFLDSGS